MCRWWMLFVACALVAIGGDAAEALGKPLASPVCAIAQVKLNATTGGVTATGSCKVAGRKVPVKWSFSYTKYDAANFVCGAAPTKGSTNSFKISTAASRAVVRIVLRTRSGKGKSDSETVKLLLGGENLQCGKLVNLPSPATLCPWRTPWPGMMENVFNNCGVPNASVSWSSPPTLSANAVTAGRLASLYGECRRVLGSIGKNTTPPAVDWLGLRQQAQHFDCKGNFYVRVNTVYLAVVNQHGQSCYEPAPIGGLRNVLFPSTWGGTLYAVFTMGIVQNSGTEQVRIVGYESQTGVFALSGTDDACKVLGKPR